MFNLLILVCLIFAACQKKEAAIPAQVVHLNINNEPPSLDPRTARDLDGANILHMLFEGLTRVSLQGKVELALAKEMEISADGLTYIFHLRKSNWSSGALLTSNDFVSSWKRMLDPGFATDAAYHLYPIKNARKAKLGQAQLEEVGIHAPDPLTLVIELEQPTPYFLELLTMSAFFPTPEQVSSNWALEAKTYVSNGPFQMKSWDHTDQITLTKNPHYWESKEVHLNEIHLLVANSDTSLRMFEEGKIDWTGSPLATIPIDSVKTLRAENKLHSSPFLATYFLRVNTTETSEGKTNPFSNSALRRALALSLDRSAIAEHLLQGGQKAAMALVPPEMGLGIEGYFSDNQPDEAKKLLHQARVEIGYDFEPIVLSYYNNERNTAIAQALQKQWEEKLQIKVELQAAELKSFFQKVAKREFQVACGSWTADFNDPINFLDVFKYKESGTNNTGWENPQYIDLLNRSALCRDSEERKQLLRKAESLLMDEMPLIPVYHFALVYLKRDDLDNVLLSPLGQMDLRWARRELNDPALQKR